MLASAPSISVCHGRQHKKHSALRRLPIHHHVWGLGAVPRAVADAAEVGEVALMIPTTTLPVAGPGEPGHQASSGCRLQDQAAAWLVPPQPPASLSPIPALESVVCFLHRVLRRPQSLFFFLDMIFNKWKKSTEFSRHPCLRFCQM